MKKQIIVLLVILISIVYSSFLMYTSFSTGKEIDKIDHPELIDKNLTLPRLYFEGDISGMSKDGVEIGIKVKYIDEKNVFEKYATIKVQGSFSSKFEKKNYTIKFFNDKNYLDKFKVDLRWGKEHKYVLKANWIDRTHSRNIVTAKLAAKVQNKFNILTETPNNGLIDGYPIEVYLNDEFYGLYTMNIPKDEWLFNMDDKNENHIVMSGYYWHDETLFRKEATYTNWKVEVGTQNQKTLDKLNRLIKFVRTSTDQEFKENIHKYIDLDATFNFYSMVQIFHLSDNYGKNLLMVTYDGQIWYPSLYDLDTSFGMYYHGESNYQTDNIVHIDDNLLFERVRKLFPNELADRYFLLRKDLLSEQNIINEINNFYSTIPVQTLRQEEAKWNNQLGFDIDVMKKYLSERLPVIDKYMASQYTVKPNCINNDSIYCQVTNNNINR